MQDFLQFLSLNGGYGNSWRLIPWFKCLVLYHIDSAFFKVLPVPVRQAANGYASHGHKTLSCEKDFRKLDFTEVIS